MYSTVWVEAGNVHQAHEADAASYAIALVDTHVQRLSQRLKLTTQAEPVKIEADLMKLIPRDRWAIFSHWLIWHGRRRCLARNPDCEGCEVQHLCPSAYKVGRKDPKK